MRRETKASRVSSPSPPSYQGTSLSWQEALLFPPCVRPISSPPQSIGTPTERTSVVRKFRCWRDRSAFTSSQSEGPSTPQFQERLSFAPSLLFSQLAQLCFSL